MFKPNPIRYDVGKQALNIKCGENQDYHNMLYDAQIYNYFDIRRNLTNLNLFEEASKIFTE